MDTCKPLWEASYARGDNWIFYPKEEVVKFLNRHVRKRRGISEFHDLLNKAPQDRSPWRALDYGCGIARHTIMLEEFGFEAHGLDISEQSIACGRDLARTHGVPQLAERLQACGGQSIPFTEGFFDITISESCLDCMPFEMARALIGEMDRVTKSLGYLSLYSGDNSDHFREFSGEVQVTDSLAEGTVRCYYNWNLIQDLIADTQWRIRDMHLVEEQSMTRRYKHGRYYIVLEK
jgi:SAM-dependent methyltransferase